jgi:hypothetical protein
MKKSRIIAGPDTHVLIEPSKREKKIPKREKSTFSKVPVIFVVFLSLVLGSPPCAYNCLASLLFFSVQSVIRSLKIPFPLSSPSLFLSLSHSIVLVGTL